MCMERLLQLNHRARKLAQELCSELVLVKLRTHGNMSGAVFICILLHVHVYTCTWNLGPSLQAVEHLAAMIKNTTSSC